MHVSAGRRSSGAAPDEIADRKQQDADGGSREAAERTAAPLPLHGSFLVAALVAGLLAHGAARPFGQRVVATLLLGGLAALVLDRRRQGGPVWQVGKGAERTRFVRPFPLLGALAGWAVVSAALNGDAGRAASTVATSAGVAIVLLLCSHLSLPHRRRVVSLFLGLGLLVALSGWAGVAWRVAPLVAEGRTHLGATTITYTNAAAAVLVVLTLLAMAVGIERGNPLRWTLATVVLLVGLGATGSRGGLLALAVGLLVLVVGLGAGPTFRAVAPPVLGALTALAGLAPSVPPGSSAQPLLAVATLGLGLGIAGGLRRAPARALLVAAAACVLAGILAITVGPLGDPVRDLRQAKSVNGWWSERDNLVRTALDVAGRRPFVGTGSDAFPATRVSGEVTRFVHNEYVQVLLDFGVVGLVLLLALLAALGRAVAGGRRSSPSPGVWIACAAGAIAFAVHSSVDVLWHLPALPLCVALLVGVTMPTPADER